MTNDSTIQQLPNGQIILNIPRPIATVMQYKKGDTIAFQIKEQKLVLHKGTDLPPPDSCPRCNSNNVMYIDGALGYEGVKCHNCHIESDLNSDHYNPFPCTCEGNGAKDRIGIKMANTSIIQQLQNGQITLNIPRAIAQALAYKKGDTMTFDMRDFALILHNDTDAQ